MNDDDDDDISFGTHARSGEFDTMLDYTWSSGRHNEFIVAQNKRRIQFGRYLVVGTNRRSKRRVIILCRTMTQFPKNECTVVQVE